ncbi:MAG TPA: hypothetical protein VGG68_15535 [Caulobacteraceae bacterium]|jgi:hypothetical protein
MNVTFSTRQRNFLAHGLVIFGVALAFVALATATGSMPSTHAVQSETLVAMAQGVFGA